MDGVKQQIYARHMEALERRHQYEVKKEQRSMKAEVEKLKDRNTDIIGRIRKDYDKALLDEKLELQTKLITVRKKNTETLQNEEMRLQRLVDEMKGNHEAKVTELEVSQSKEVDNMQHEHRNYIDNAERRFQAEKTKIETQS